MKVMRKRTLEQIKTTEYRRGYEGGRTRGREQAEDEYTLDMRRIEQAGRHHKQVIRLEAEILQLRDHNQQLQDALDLVGE